MKNSFYSWVLLLWPSPVSIFFHLFSNWWEVSCNTSVAWAVSCDLFVSGGPGWWSEASWFLRAALLRSVPSSVPSGQRGAGANHQALPLPGRLPGQVHPGQPAGGPAHLSALLQAALHGRHQVQHEQAAVPVPQLAAGPRPRQTSPAALPAAVWGAVGGVHRGEPGDLLCGQLRRGLKVGVHHGPTKTQTACLVPRHLDLGRLPARQPSQVKHLQEDL